MVNFIKKYEFLIFGLFMIFFGISIIKIDPKVVFILSMHYAFLYKRFEQKLKELTD